MEIFTDFPERLRPGSTVYHGVEHHPVTIAGIREADKLLLISFEGYSSREAVAELRNQPVYILTSQLPILPEGEYYHHELIGLRVVDESDRFLGTVEEILETGANDVYIIRQGEDPELLIPAIAEVILNVDIEKGVMTVRPQSWE